MILWGAGTTRTLRAHWALHELGLEYERRPIGSRTGETQDPAFRKLNPREKIPVLQDGDLVLAESAAIVSYLAETYGKGPALIPPVGTPDRAAYYEWAFFIMTELDAHTLYVMRKHRDLPELYGEAPEAIRTAQQGFEKQVRVAERKLADAPCLLGERFSGVDILLTTCLTWAAFYRIPLHPTLRAYVDRTTGREAYGRAAAANRPS